MLRRRREEKRQHRRRRRDGTVDLMNDADDQIKELVENMKAAAKVNDASLSLLSLWSNVDLYLFVLLQIPNMRCNQKWALGVILHST